jgi:Transglutaminase-like superfamily
MRTPSDLLDAAKSAGLDVTGIELVPIAGGGHAYSARMTFEDPWAAARLLTELAAEDAGDPVVRAWAQEIAEATAEATGETEGPGVSGELRDAIARALHANVQSQIRFVHEPVETFQSARVTMQVGEGDCDDHARLLYALAGAVAIPAVMTFFEEEDEGQPVPAHAVVRLQDSDGSWQWAETTIDADYGEEPHDALDRLMPADGANPLSHVAGARAGAGGGQVGGISGPFGFVTPSDVQARKDQVNAEVEATDVDVVNCKTLDSGTLSAWNLFLVAWREFYADEPGFFSAGAQGRQVADYVDQLAEWQTRLKAAGCTLTSAPLPAQPQDDVAGTVKVVAIALAVGAAAFGAYEVAKIVRR